jgi:hypothetical protein
MSIHNKVAVPEEEMRGSHYTRDRFGKKHDISNVNGSLRVRRVKKNLLVLALLPTVPLLWGSATLMAQSGRNTNVQIESSSLDEWTIDDKLNTPQDEKPIFYDDGSTSVGFNENGDPNMSMRF